MKQKPTRWRLLCQDKFATCWRPIRLYIHSDSIYVNFESFRQNGLVLIYFFTKTTIWKEYLKVKEDVNLKLMHILDDLGVKVAYPSMSVYMEKQHCKSE